MTTLKPGDLVSCRVKDGRVVLAYADYDSEKTFEILASVSGGYFIYLPEYLNLYGGTKIDSKEIKSLEIGRQFLGGTMFYLTSTMICRVVSTLDGCHCAECEEFFKYAVPNQEDGTLVCYSCRRYPIYASGAHDED